MSKHNTYDVSVLSYGTGFTMWHYRTKNELSDVLAKGYFHDSRDMIRLNDLLVVNAAGNNNALLFATEFMLGEPE